MTLISIEQLEPAMVLAADVRSRTGRLLATRNTAITAQHLIAFRTWGVLEVETFNINSDNNGVGSVLSPPDQDQIDKAISSLLPHFRLNELSHPLIAELLRLAATKKAAKDEG